MYTARSRIGCPMRGMEGEFSMSGRYEHRRGRRRRSRHRSARSADAPELQDEELLEAELLTEEELALRRARREAERKTKLTGDMLKFGLITLLLLIVFPPAGVVMLIFCGWRYAREFYAMVMEPRLRQRFLQEEIAKQVRAQVSDERERLEGHHARSMEQLSASIAHEIRNPITAAKSLVQQMEEEPTAKENVEYARIALEELQRVERSVSHLLRFARDEEMRKAPVRLADVVDSALETFRDRVARSGIALERRLDCEGRILGDAEKLRRILINLVGNAIDALGQSGTPGGGVRVELGENLAGTEVWLRVADDGPGIEPEALARLFSPFYTSKADGTGLGLPICKKLVEAHDGSIEVSSEPGRGAEFVLTFPRAAAPEGDPS